MYESDKVKYLGITLDKKLAWRSDYKTCKEMTNPFFQCSRAVGISWELPQVL